MWMLAKGDMGLDTVLAEAGMIEAMEETIKAAECAQTRRGLD